MDCKSARFAYRFFPLPAWRAFLLARHIDACPSCRALGLGDEAVRALGMTPADLAGEPPLSPFAGGAQAPSGRGASGFRWQYAYGLFLAAALLWAIVALIRLAPPAPPAQGMVSVTEGGADIRVFAVRGARIGGGPARAVVFKPRQPGMTIVWFERIEN